MFFECLLVKLNAFSSPIATTENIFKSNLKLKFAFGHNFNKLIQNVEKRPTLIICHSFI